MQRNMKIYDELISYVETLSVYQRYKNTIIGFLAGSLQLANLALFFITGMPPAWTVGIAVFIAYAEPVLQRLSKGQPGRLAIEEIAQRAALSRDNSQHVNESVPVDVGTPNSDYYRDL